MHHKIIVIRFYLNECLQAFYTGETVAKNVRLNVYKSKLRACCVASILFSNVMRSSCNYEKQ